MKSIVIIVLFFISCIPSGSAQTNKLNDHLNQNSPNAFKIIDTQTIAANYMIVSCRDDFGRTIQFINSTEQTAEIANTIPLPSLGTIVMADFTSGTVSENDNPIKYKIITPTFLNQCCSIAKIEYRINNQPVDFVIAKPDTANGFIYFSKKASPISPAISLKIGQPIYQNTFNNKRYAIIEPSDAGELYKNIFYSYEFNFMSHELYSSIHKEKLSPIKEKVIPNEVPVNINVSYTASTPDLLKADTIKTEVSSIMFGKNMSTGIIHVDVPANVEYTFNIYSPSDHKLLYNSSQQQNFSLFPGIYDIEVSGTTVKNVVVDKGMDTRIKAGTLNMIYDTTWALFDENNLQKIYSAATSKKIEFAQGVYQIEMKGVMHRIEIKDGQTLKFDSSMLLPKTPQIDIANSNKIPQSPKINTTDLTKTTKAQKTINADSTNTTRAPKVNTPKSTNVTKAQKVNNPDSNKIIQALKVNNKPVNTKVQKVNNTDSINAIKTEVNTPLPNDKKWEIKPTTLGKGATGKIFLKIPKTVECIMTVYQSATGLEVFYSGALTNERNFSLIPGMYNLEISGTLVKNIPVQKGMDTRIKAGILNVVATGIWTLFDEKKKQIYFSTTPRKIGLPTGIYQIEISGTTQQIIIKDGETEDF